MNRKSAVASGPISYQGLGYWDCRRFSTPAEMAIPARNNPFNRDFVHSLILLADSIAKIQDGETDKAEENLNKIKEIMTKWS